jgi:transposase
MIIEPLIPPAKPGGRPRTVDIFEILNGIIYRVITGCQWELLPKDFPPCKTVYVKNTFDWILEIVLRKEKEFKVMPFMWIVERTFAWFNNYRGLSKDYECSTKSSEGVFT